MPGQLLGVEKRRNGPQYAETAERSTSRVAKKMRDGQVARSVIAAATTPKLSRNRQPPPLR